MSVRVVARIRPLLGSKELEKDSIVRAERSSPDGPMNVVRIPNPKNETEEFSYTFNGVYDIETTQEELFTREGTPRSPFPPRGAGLPRTDVFVVAPTLKSLFQGLDVTLFAYGVTGTGKTHTMRGGLKLSERGVIPRLLSAIYRRGRKVAKDSQDETQVSVTLSYYEIYNDKVFDLFEPPSARTPSGLPLREAAGGKTVVVGLSERACGDLKDFEKLYIEANNNRSTAGTKLNAQSSRSHAILMVKVSQATGDQVRVSTASAIDLAGSEDNRRTENGKERMIESASINKSLFVLSQCIDAIGRGDKRIPYRESKMTRILSLGQNNGITIMILNLAPLRSYHLDTLSSLNVSSRAKRIEVREIENEIVYKQPPRTATASVGGVGMARQPLRPLANAHNAHMNAAAAAAEQKAGVERPLKAFSVYSDKSKARLSNGAAHGVIRGASIKRPSDAGQTTRPSKISRPNPAARAPDALSAASIEAIVQRKVSEILAAQAASLPPPIAPAVPDNISAAVQARLDALERKIEAGVGKGDKEDARNEGLRFLLMAKQHKERGEDASALKCYELAEPFFPAQEKLKRKMEVLRAKIRAKREAQNGHGQLPTPAASFSDVAAAVPEDVFVQAAPRPARRRVRSEEGSDDEYHAVSPVHSLQVDEDDSFVFKPAAKPRKTKAAGTLRVFDDQETGAPPTPRTRYLLDVVNSRDEALIKGLSGFGAKKARDLVAWLEERAEEGGAIGSLAALKAVPGMGGKTIERALGGVALGA